MNKNQTRGFTLIELLITIGIVGIIAMVGIPSFSNSIKKNSVAASINNIQTTLIQARGEAVTQNITVSICSSDDQATCSGTWSDGWIVFSDENEDGTIDAGDLDKLLHVAGELKADNELRLVAGTAGIIQYQSTGYSDQTGVFISCPADDDTSYSRALIVSSSGMIRKGRDSDSNGIYEDNLGVDLTCP